jgi:hypothetical protein
MPAHLILAACSSPARLRRRNRNLRSWPEDRILPLEQAVAMNLSRGEEDGAVFDRLCSSDREGRPPAWLQA